MRLFSSKLNRDRARWLLVLLLGFTVIYISRNLHFAEGVSEILKAMGVQNLFSLA